MKKPQLAFNSCSMLRPPFQLLLFAYFLFSTLQNTLLAQQKPSKEVKTSFADQREQLTVGYMRANGATEETIGNWIKEYRTKGQATGIFQNPIYQDKNYPVTSAVGTCADMGGENGWGAWEASTGYNTYPGSVPLGATFDLTGIVYPNPATLGPPPPPSPNWDVTNAPPAGVMGPYGPRFDLTSAGTNTCTPGPAPGAPALPFVCPGFGSHSIQLGEHDNTGAGGYCNRVMGGIPAGTWIGGGCAERLTYNLLVSPSDTNFTYAYAVVLENPCNAVHHRHEVPYAEIYILAPNGIDTIGCTYHKYMGDTTGSCNPPLNSGMWKGSCQGPGGGSGNGYDVGYMPWTTVSLNLAAYVGQVVKVVITNVDCSLGVHYCYSYWDFKCSPPTASTIPVCAGQQTTISGPTSPGSTYVWYQNHHLYTGPPSATSQNITPTPALGDTFMVEVIQASGCKYAMFFIPEPITIVPSFSVTPGCGSSVFADNSTVLPVSATNTILAWNWQLPGGTPATSSSQNPGTITYAPGTYTATLIVTSSAGCTDTIKHTFTVTGLSTTITATPEICGANNGTTNLTVSSGTAPYSYSWSPSGGNGPMATGLNAGTYTLMTTDATGCKKNDTITVNATGVMIAAANNSTICAGQNTTLTASGGANYTWSTGATTASISPPTTASATYSVIVSAGACIDTAFASVTVNPSPTVSLGADQTICTGQNATLDAGNPGPNANYIWSTGATTQTINAYLGGTYWVIVALSNCLAKDTIQTFTAPGIQLNDQSLCTMSPLTLDPGGGASTYLWSDGSTSQTITVDVAGNYWVEVTYGNCKSSDTAAITGDGTGGSLYIPNAFTPNDDNLNEVFLAKGTGILSIEMSIFDRWGNRLFVSDDITKGWDGKIQGGNYLLKGDGREVSQEDVYICKINYTTYCYPKQIKNEIGIVSIVK